MLYQVTRKFPFSVLLDSIVERAPFLPTNYCLHIFVLDACFHVKCGGSAVCIPDMEHLPRGKCVEIVTTATTGT